MKNFLAVSMLAIGFLSNGLSISWADDEAAATGVSGTSSEFSDMEKSLKQERADQLEQRLSDLEQSNRFMSERIKMIRKDVDDLKDKIDRRSF